METTKPLTIKEKYPGINHYVDNSYYMIGMVLSEKFGIRWDDTGINLNNRRDNIIREVCKYYGIPYVNSHFPENSIADKSYEELEKVITRAILTCS